MSDRTASFSWAELPSGLALVIGIPYFFENVEMICAVVRPVGRKGDGIQVAFLLGLLHELGELDACGRAWAGLRPPLRAARAAGERERIVRPAPADDTATKQGTPIDTLLFQTAQELVFLLLEVFHVTSVRTLGRSYVNCEQAQLRATRSTRLPRSRRLAGMADPWSSGGSWLRCALHAHTTESDGEMPPASLVIHYERAGYDVLALTDHWKITESPSTERLLVIPSVELNCVLPGARDGHVLGLGVKAEAEELRELAGGYPTLEETGTWIVERGGLAFLAHPYWTGVTPGTRAPRHRARDRGLQRRL